MALVVNEIFHSLQGESTFAGQPCVFIRLTGCNLRCTYCDTTYAYEAGDDYSIEKIMRTVRSYDCKVVEITGGEPLMQEDTPRLVDRLLAEKRQVLMETNGSLNIDLVSDRCIRIVDVKCPSSGEEKQNDFENLRRITPADELKFVIGDEVDYAYARDIVQSIGHKIRTHGKIHFSPVFGRLHPRKLAQWIIADNLDLRLQLQIHKYIWHPDQRGV